MGPGMSSTDEAAALLVRCLLQALCQGSLAGELVDRISCCVHAIKGLHSMTIIERLCEIALNQICGNDGLWIWLPCRLLLKVLSRDRQLDCIRYKTILSCTGYIPIF